MKLKDILSSFHGLTKIVTIEKGVKKQEILDLPLNSVKIYTEFDKSMKRNMIVVRGVI